MAVLEKKLLSVEDLESQTAFVLPDRELMQGQIGLVNIVVGDVCVVCGVSVAVAAAICNVNVNVLAVQLAQQGEANCPANADAKVVRVQGRN